MKKKELPPEQMYRRQAEYREKNRARINSYAKAYYHANKEKMIAQARERQIKKILEENR